MLRAEAPAAEAARRERRRGWAAPALALGLLLAALWNLGGSPMWWDEGWTLSVARTFVERGLYARLLDGAPAPIGLEGAWPVVALVIASFKALGVGVWQGRLVGALCIPLAAAALAWLAGMLHGRRIAAGAIAVMLLLSMHPQTNLVVQGRQVLGEVPMLVCLCGGLGCLLAGLRRGPHWLLPAVALLALALLIKGQVQPFLAVGLLSGAGAALWMRRWRAAGLLAAGLLAYPLAGALNTWWFAQLGARLVAGPPISGLTSVMAVVISLPSRVYALAVGLIFGLLTLLGMLRAARLAAADLREPGRLAPEAADRLAFEVLLLGLVGSWVAWFILLSVGVLRYLFPAIYLGSIFVALLLHGWTAGYDLGAVRRRFAELRAVRGPSRERLAFLFCGAFLIMALGITTFTYVRYLLLDEDLSALRVAALLNAETPPGSRIETYESELHFLLDRPYHYPPDQAHVSLNRRSLLGEDAEVAYDPLESDPDYLVVGTFALNNRLYRPALQGDQFRLRERIGKYWIYERVR